MVLRDLQGTRVHSAHIVHDPGNGEREMPSLSGSLNTLEYHGYMRLQVKNTQCLSDSSQIYFIFHALQGLNGIGIS